MNHYPHHIGDYLKKTIGLTMRQDGAYRRMLDLYYGDEKPLPLDRVDLFGSLRCRDRADQGAVEHCLRKYFVEREDGFHHDRCDEEIAKYREKSAKASASASARWDQTESDRNANALPENMRTHSVGNAKAMLAINQEPRTKNQEVQEPGAAAPKSRPKNGVHSLGTRLPDDWRLPEEWKAWALEIRPDWTPQGVVRESISFRDYWIAASGSKAVKRNWLATWRTWIRRAKGEPTL